MTPHKHHGGTGGGTEQDSTGEIIGCKVGGDETLKQYEEEYPSDAKHCKGFYKPVCHPGDHKAFWIFAHIFYALKIHLEHHGVNHKPDKNCNGYGNIGILKGGEEIGDSG